MPGKYAGNYQISYVLYDPQLGKKRLPIISQLSEPIPISSHMELHQLILDKVHSDYLGLRMKQLSGSIENGAKALKMHIMPIEH